MPGRIVIEADDDAVRALALGWVASARLDPPADVTLAFELADRVAPPDDPRPAFVQPNIRIFAGGGRDTAVHWSERPAAAVLPVGSRRALVRLGPEALDRPDRVWRQFVLTVLILLLRRVGWHHVHAAAAVDPRGRGWLLAGDTQCGKSTTAALLALRGWSVGGDDAMYLAATGEGVQVHAQHGHLALREGGTALLGRAGGAVIREGRKTGFFPEDLGGAWAPRVRPEILVFPTVGGERTMLEPLARQVALAELVRWSAWVTLEPDLAQGHLDLLARLAGQARAFRARLAPDLFDHRDLLLEAVP